jgi:hypothetical protein
LFANCFLDRSWRWLILDSVLSFGHPPEARRTRLKPCTTLIAIASLTYAALLPLPTLASTLQHDPLLEGLWQGQRNPDGPCKYLAWTLERTPDGKFTTRYFQDAQRLAFIDEEQGTWHTASGLLTVLIEGDDSPAIFAYHLRDKDTVAHSLLTVDPDTSCPDDAAFSEHRVVR